MSLWYPPQREAIEVDLQLLTERILAATDIHPDHPNFSAITTLCNAAGNEMEHVSGDDVYATCFNHLAAADTYIRKAEQLRFGYDRRRI